MSFENSRFVASKVFMQTVPHFDAGLLIVGYQHLSLFLNFSFFMKKKFVNWLTSRIFMWDFLFNTHLQKTCPA